MPPLPRFTRPHPSDWGDFGKRFYEFHGRGAPQRLRGRQRSQRPTGTRNCAPGVESQGPKKRCWVWSISRSDKHPCPKPIGPVRWVSLFVANSLPNGFAVTLQEAEGAGANRCAHPGFPCGAVLLSHCRTCFSQAIWSFWAYRFQQSVGVTWLQSLFFFLLSFILLYAFRVV
jgi:hypothetical protein